MTYLFHGFNFEFTEDGLFVTDERHLPYYEKYKITFEDNRSFPFVITMEERGRLK